MKKKEWGLDERQIMELYKDLLRLQKTRSDVEKRLRKSLEEMEEIGGLLCNVLTEIQKMKELGLEM